MAFEEKIGDWGGRQEELVLSDYKGDHLVQFLQYLISLKK
jgi:hypothetical protein